jgi:tetratricopeptide (TPR) repeat protein
MSNEFENLFVKASEALEAKQFAAAEVLQRHGCKLLRENGAEKARLAAELEKLADIHCIQKKFEECAGEYSEVVQLRESFLPPNDFMILRPLYRMAKSNFEGQKYDRAEAEMRKALSLAESRTDSTESLAFCLYELGFLLYYIGKYEESESYLLRALPICEAVRGISHRETVKVLGALGLLYRLCPEFGKDPEPYFRRAIEASKLNLELRQFYLWNLYRLASFFEESKRLDDAKELFLQLLSDIREKPEGSESENWGIVSGCVKYFTKRGEADLVADLVSSKTANRNAYGETVRERLEHAERTLSPDDPELADALLAAANNATFDGKYQEAESLLGRAVEACLRIHGENSSQALFALTRVCINKRLLGKFGEAELAIQRAVNGAREHFHDQGFYPWTLESLALLREAQAKADDASRIFAEAVTEYERICGFPSYETAEALYHQSACLLRLGLLDSAEVSIRRAIGVMDLIEGLSPYEKSDYLSTLASILEAAGRNAEATETQKHADQLFNQARAQDQSEE